MTEITGSIPPGEIARDTEIVFVAGQAFVNAVKHERVVDDLRAELDEARLAMKNAVYAIGKGEPALGRRYLDDALP